MSCRVDRILNKHRYVGACQQLTLAKELAVATKASLMLDYYSNDVSKVELLGSGQSFISVGTRELYLQLVDLLTQIASNADAGRYLAFVNDEKESLLEVAGEGTVTSSLPVQIGIWSRLCGAPAAKILLKTCRIGPLNYASEDVPEVFVNVLGPGFNVLASTLYSITISLDGLNPINLMDKLSVSVPTGKDFIPQAELGIGAVLKGGTNLCEAWDCLISHLSFLTDYTSTE
jgi:hypothetical protein